MTITKIIGVDYPSDLKATHQYIINSAKTALRDHDLRSQLQMLGPTRTSEDGLPRGDYARMLEWSDEKNTVIPVYVSAHLCQPDSVIEDFLDTAMCSARMRGDRPSRPIAYEFVQSFEDDPELSDELVHQLGLQLGEAMFHEYPYVMASHVNPVLDDDHRLRGKFKHNHFLISAYKSPEFCREEGPVKLNKNHELEDRLREMNDRLAIDHDLTIVRNADLHRSTSWYQQKLADKGLSWVQKTRDVVLSVRDQTTRYDEFLVRLAEHGYTIRDESHLVYVTPDGDEIRAEHLGSDYTKESLQLHWLFVDQLQDLMEDMLRARPPAPLRTLMDQYGPLFVDIPVGVHKSGKQQYHPMSLQKVHHRKETLERYFDPLQWYAVKDQAGTVVTQMTGYYILDYMEAMRRDELPVWATTAPPSKKARQIDEDYWYVGPDFQTNIEAERYRVCNYNADGTRRSSLEVSLRYKIIKDLGDHVFRRTLEPPQLDYMISTESVLQPRLDAIQIMRKEGVKNTNDLRHLLFHTSDRLEQIDRIISSEAYSMLSEENRNNYLVQKAGLEHRIERLKFAMMYIDMTYEELEKSYTPKTYLTVFPKEEPQPFKPTLHSLSEMIRRASSKKEQASYSSSSRKNEYPEH